MTVLHPRILDLIDLWRSLRRGGDVPVRRDLDAEALRPWMGWLTIYEELDGGADFLVRLDGTCIVELTGAEWTGRRVSALGPGYAGPLCEVLGGVLAAGEPRVDLHYVPAAKDVLAFQRATLPVLEDRRGARQLLQCLVPAG